MEAAGLCETLVSLYQTTLLHIRDNMIREAYFAHLFKKNIFFSTLKMGTAASAELLVTFY
jgi:hypothetical protein